jgi:ankyrin repeat protein
MTALMFAAIRDRPAIVEQLVVARADVNAKRNISGCAHFPRPVRRPRWSPTVPIAPAPSGRDTALHCAAYHGRTESAVPLLVGGADQTITNNEG